MSQTFRAACGKPQLLASGQPLRPSQHISLNGHRRHDSTFGRPPPAAPGFVKYSNFSKQRISRKRTYTAPSASITDAAVLLQDSPLRDVFAFVFSIIGARVLIKIFDKLEEMQIIDRVSKSTLMLPAASAHRQLVDGCLPHVSFPPPECRS